MNERSASDERALTPQELIRYSRQILLAEFGESGQRRLRSARVLIVGLGGLGSPAAIYLAAAGIGQLGLADSDTVELSNIHRQPLHTTDRIGQPKTASAASTLRALNPHVDLRLHELRLTAENVVEIIRDYDLVVDASDNFAARYLTNDACAVLAKPLIYGSIFRFEGQVAVFDVRRGPCYRCLYPEAPPLELVPDCAQAGVIGILPGLIGLLQATEAVKCLTSLGQPLIGRLLTVDTLTMSFRAIAFERDPACPICGLQPTVRTPDDVRKAHIATITTCATTEEISPADLKVALDRGEPVILVDVRDPVEYQRVHLTNARLIPLGELDQRAHEIPRDQPVVLYCRSGCRSATAWRQLRDRGYTNVKNLRGGILAWATEVDPELLRY